MVLIAIEVKKNKTKQRKSSQSCISMVNLLEALIRHVRPVGQIWPNIVLNLPLYMSKCSGNIILLNKFRAVHPVFYKSFSTIVL